MTYILSTISSIWICIWLSTVIYHLKQCCCCYKRWIYKEWNNICFNSIKDPPDLRGNWVFRIHSQWQDGHSSIKILRLGICNEEEMGSGASMCGVTASLTSLGTFAADID